MYSASGPKAIPGYTGHMRNAKDRVGVSSGKALEEDSKGNDGIYCKKGQRSAAGSSLLSPLDTDGAVWDHRYETTQNNLSSSVSQDYTTKLAAAGKVPPPTVVGYTGHIHMGQEVLGASHDTVTRISDKARAEQRLHMNPVIAEGRPHWTTFRNGGLTNTAWKQEFSQAMTTRPTAKGSKGGAAEDKDALLQSQIKAAEAVLGSTPTYSKAASFKASFTATHSPRKEYDHEDTRIAGPQTPEDEKSYSGHHSAALPNKHIVGYTGHLRGAQDHVGVNYGRLERKMDPHAKFVEPPHPLGQRYQNAAPPGPLVDDEVKRLVTKVSQPRTTGHAIIDDVVKKILARGGKNGFRSLARILRVMDDDGSKSLNRYELQNGLNTYGIFPSQVEMDDLLVFFDADGSGQISLSEFVRAVRGEMSAYRRDLVLQAYALLDANSDGTVTIADIKRLYDTARHPEVLAGIKTAKEVMVDFIAGWDRDDDGCVTQREFLEYYSDLSAAIDNDQYFELMIRNAWHISGGEGAAQNTSCRRVLVTHLDGTQTVEEIQNDLGISIKDKEKMLQKLIAQGVTDIKRIDLNY